MTKTAKYILIGLLLTTASCSDYWWSRGEVPSPKDLYNKSEAKLQTFIHDNSKKRAEIASISSQMISALSSVIELESDKKDSNILHSIEIFSNLDGIISYGSRPAYAELAGELRAFASQAREKKLSKEAFLLYSSRVFDFLSNELSVSYTA